MTFCVLVETASDGWGKLERSGHLDGKFDWVFFKAYELCTKKVKHENGGVG